MLGRAIHICDIFVQALEASIRDFVDSMLNASHDSILIHKGPTGQLFYEALSLSLHL